MRPFAAIGVTNLLVDSMTSLGVPPSNTTAPVSPSKAKSLVVIPVERVHITASACPSVVVTMGEPFPPCRAHQTTVGVGGFVAAILTPAKSPPCPAGHLRPAARKTTYVPCDVV